MSGTGQFSLISFVAVLRQVTVIKVDLSGPCGVKIVCGSVSLVARTTPPKKNRYNSRTMSAQRILVADDVSDSGLQPLRDAGFQVEKRTGLSPTELQTVIAGCVGLV